MGRRYQSFQRRILKFFAVLLGLMLALMIAITAFVQNTMEQIHLSENTSLTLSREQISQLLTSLSGEEPNAPALPPEDVSFHGHDTIIGGKGSGIVNILLIGQDRRSQDEQARSDTMILCTFNKKEKTLTLTSFLRDLYVQIPGYEDNRINTAYAIGGSTLLNETLKHNFGILIDANVEVDFSEFSSLINLLGGVSIELRQDEADAINKTVPGNLTAGQQWLTGEQALAYSRIRNLDADGDFSRTNRQRKVIGALLEAYKDADLKELVSLFQNALPMIHTDLGESGFLRLAINLFPMLSGAELASQRIPAEDAYVQRSIRGMSVLVADMDAAREMLIQTLLN